jgi:hypothetical protein
VDEAGACSVDVARRYDNGQHSAAAGLLSAGAGAAAVLPAVAVAAALLMGW